MNKGSNAVAILREQPYSNSNFLVDFGSGDARALTAGFCEIIFPEFRADTTTQNPADPAAQLQTDPARAGGGNYLVLKRGVMGSLDLYDWWNKARHGKASKRRTLKIELLSEDHTTVVLTWRFFNVCPVTLSYSPLYANQNGILIETLTVSFERMGMQ